MTDLTVSLLGLNQIVQFEISSEAFYNQRLSNPTYPGGSSGVTVGIGYDLGYNTQATIKSDWQNQISDKDLTRLLEAAGKKGKDAKDLIPGLIQVKVPLAAAKQVFYKSTLPRYEEYTASLSRGRKSTC